MAFWWLCTLPFFVTLLNLYFLTVSPIFFYSSWSLLNNYVYLLLRFLPIKSPRERSGCSKVVLVCDFCTALFHMHCHNQTPLHPAVGFGCWWRQPEAFCRSAQLQQDPKPLGWFAMMRSTRMDMLLLSPLHYLRCLYVTGCSSSSVTSHAILLTVIHVLFYLMTGALWGHKGKHWTNICLPLRIFLHVRLYRFNLLCFVTNNTGEFCCRRKSGQIFWWNAKERAT